jgi:hypothetical protein
MKKINTFRDQKFENKPLEPNYGIWAPKSVWSSDMYVYCSLLEAHAIKLIKFTRIEFMNFYLFIQVVFDILIWTKFEVREGSSHNAK